MGGESGEKKIVGMERFTRGSMCLIKRKVRGHILGSQATFTKVPSHQISDTGMERCIGPMVLTTRETGLTGFRKGKGN